MKEIEELTRSDFLDGDEPYLMVWELRDDPFQQERLKEKLKARAKELRVTNFVRTYQNYEKKKKEINKAVFRENTTQFEGQELELISREWICDEFGVTKYGDRQEIVACNHPILPVERLVNVDTGVEKLKLAFRKGKQWRHVTADKKTLAGNNQILELANAGVAVTSDSAKYLVQYLHDIENYNYDIIPEHNSVSRLGWISEDTFAPYVDDLVFEGEDGHTAAFKAIHSKGSFKRWKELVTKARAHSSIVKIILAGSFASVLVKKVNALSFFIHLWSAASGTGKTVALCLAASVWGSPVMGEYVKTFYGTVVSNEQTAGFLNSLPYIMDEFQLNRNKKDFEPLLYMLAEGVGKGRGAKSGGVQRTPTWRNAILTSGETRITEYMTGAGAYNRIVEIECTTELFSDAPGIMNALGKDYGHAGRMFVEKLLDEENITLAQELYNGFYQRIIQNDTTEKQAMAGAVILTADALVCRWILPGEKPLTVDELSQFLHTKAEVDVGQRAYDYLCDTVAMNINKFDLTNENTERWGKAENGKAYIIKTVFDRICTDGGFSPGSTLSWLEKQNLIELSHSKERKKPLQTKTTCLKGARTRCVVLTIQSENFVHYDEENFIPD